ncbi:ABC transporter permease [Leifsonia sp. F6_8S_P_1B]|uniref:ABC transporter permease n=1 Tax=Leifsonia williamsii TaxID=3035919 RepID=A0ABT8K6G0_9MICO|nr:ABC transporter permease [Leifsonia williamsii]MDN4613016.1 ABC transporter permease [Leifsonia williamsii]
MRTVRTVVLSGVLGFRALFAWNTPGLFVTSLVLTPALQIVFFVAVGAAFDYQNPVFFIVGNGVQVAATAGIAGMVSVIADERRFGTLSMVLGAPTSRIAVFVGRMLPGMACGFAVAALTSSVGLLAVGRAPTLSQVGGYALAIGVATVSCSAMGLALSAFGLIYREIFQIATAAYLLLMVVSGANIDRAALPGWVRGLGDVLPTTHSIDGIRDLLSGGALPALAAPLLMELAVAAAWTAGALVLMKLLESLAKRRAALDLY